MLCPGIIKVNGNTIFLFIDYEETIKANDLLNSVHLTWDSVIWYLAQTHHEK